MGLTSDEIQRYARHIVLRGFGGTGQQKLKEASVLVIGAGGLGSPVLQYLAAAGVGRLGIVDNDVVSISNLQRQTIHKTSLCEIPKTDSARSFIEALNHNIEIDTYQMRFNADNAARLVAEYTLIVDGSDNFETRYLVADTCETLKKTLITAAVSQYDGSITTIKPHICDADGQFFPRYRDIFPHIPPKDLLPVCEDAGIIGALTGIIGSMQAMEVIKEITGIGQSLAGRLQLFDAKSSRWHEISYSRDTVSGSEKDLSG